jgi:GH24 family phage-related lysozyme (muramidase)
MVKLPDYRAQRGLNPGGAPQIQTDRSAIRQFGGVGSAIQGVGDVAFRVAKRAKEIEEQKEEFAAKQAYAQMNAELDQSRVEMLEAAPEDGSGFTESFMNETLSQKQVEFFQKIPERLHEQYGLQLQTDAIKWDSQARKDELTRLYDSTAVVIGEQSNQLLNAISLDADSYDESLAAGLDLINVSPLPPIKKAEARREWEAAALKALAIKMIEDDPEQAQKALGGGSVASGSAAKQAASLLRDFEGFRDGTYWDVNAHRVGYGSDTITKADGSVHKVKKGDTVSRADAERDLARRAKLSEGVAIKQVGADEWAGIPAPARGALISIAYNYGDLPDSVARAAKSGDTELIARAVEDLKGHNGGVNSGRRQKEANIIRGAESIKAPGSIDPVFQGMDFADRQKALNLAEQGIADRQSAVISELAAMKGAFQLQIATDDPNLTAQDILASPLKDSDKATLINSYETARKEQRENASFAARLAGGGEFDPYGTDDRKGVDNFFEKVAGGVSVLDDQGAQSLARDIYQQSGIIPKTAVNQIRRGLGSTDPEAVAQAAALSVALESDRPNEPGLLGARDGGSELERAASLYRNLTENLGYSHDDAGAHMAEMNDPQKRREREALLETESAKDAIKEIGVDTVAAALDPDLFGFSPKFRDPSTEAFAVSEYRQLWKENFIRAAGKTELADNLTNDQIAKRYGVSDFIEAGDEKIVRYPVEATYAPIDGSHEWIAEQLESAFREGGYSTDYDPTTGEAAEKHYDAGKIYLEPTIETEQDVKAGVPPRYLISYESGGVVYQYPGFFVPDHKRAATARSEAAISAQKENSRQAKDFQQNPPDLDWSLGAINPQGSVQ